MFNSENILSNLSNAVVIEIMSGRYDYKSITLKFPTNDLDESYVITNSGKGFSVKWEGMDLISEDFKIDKGEFVTLYKECLKELIKREDFKIGEVK